MMSRDPYRQSIYRKYFLTGVRIFLVFTVISCRPDTEKLFSPVSSFSSGIDFSNDLSQSENFNIIEYLYYFNGGGIAAGDINNDGLIDLYFTSNQGKNKLYLNKGSLTFKDITAKAKVGGETGLQKWTNGATMVDINADGFLDIYVCEMDSYKQLAGINKLYINQGDLTFEENAAGFGLDISTYSQHATFFDYDLDGDLDMFLLNLAVHTPESYKRAGLREKRDSLSGDRLYRNDDGKFTDVSAQAGIYGGSMGYGLAVSIGDVNNDGLPDIYVANDFHENDYLYYNRGDGTFEEDIRTSMGHLSAFSMGNDMADFNNDGWLDIFTLDMKPEDEIILKKSSGLDSYDVYRYKLQFGYHYQYPRNMLHLNRGNLFSDDRVRFSEIGQLAGVSSTDWSWSVLFSDFDNDGYKDLFITNGIPSRPNDLDYVNFTSNEARADSASALELVGKMPSGEAKNYAFKQNGLTFEDVSARWGLNKAGYSHGAIAADLDNDGDVDLVVNNLREKATLYRNNTREKDSGNYVSVKIKGPKPNHLGIGAGVKVWANGICQTLENQITRGWLSGTTHNTLLFGVRTATILDSAVITWPDGKQQWLYDQPANSMITLDYADAQVPVPEIGKTTKRLFADVTSRSGIDFNHRENSYLDFTSEKLLPHLLSTEGPKISVGDVNNDGLDDFFIGGAKGQPGELYLQQAAGKYYFRKSHNKTFAAHAAREDAGSVFFDADQDGDPDLYVVSGGGEPVKSEVMQDRLYLNDGRGNFSFDPDALPPARFNGSCVVPFDANGDGKPDLFVGGRSTPFEYGIPGVSRFFINKGGGKFIDVTGKLLENSGRIGMVTDATWVEERKELIVVGEWMPVTIYSFSDGNIGRNRLPNSSGWWNTIHAEDMDGDGDKDLLLGNLGLNTNLTASVQEPLDLYVRDYDGNLSMDPVMAYYRQGKQWVYPDLDLLSSQIVRVKRKYRTYHAYASSRFPEVFPASQLEKSYHARTNTLHSQLYEYDQGDYRIKNLPHEAQLSPVFGFATDNIVSSHGKDVIAVGNFFGTQPAIGRLDASFGTVLRNDGPGGFNSIPPLNSGFGITGDVRDIKILNTAKQREKLLLVSRNNDDVLLFTYTGL